MIARSQRLFLGVVVLSLGVLAGCGGSKRLSIKQQFFPQFVCGSPAPAIDLGTAKGRYYVTWVDAFRIAVMRVESYGSVILETNTFKDMDHVADVWVVDARSKKVSKVGQAWIDALMARLEKTNWDFKVRVGASIVSGMLGGKANKFVGTLVQPTGQRIAYQGEMSSGTLRLITDFGDSGTLPMSYYDGGYKAALLGAQVSPEGRFVKSDLAIRDLQTGRQTQMFTRACAGLSAAAVDPTWRAAAMLLAKDGHYQLVITSFNPYSQW